LLLAGCSPHPGSGIWIATSENEPGFKKIDVQFEGRADIYTATDEVAVRRCFWGSMSPTQLALDCVQAADTEIKENYRLNVSEDGTAELTRKQQGDEEGKTFHNRVVHMVITDKLEKYCSVHKYLAIGLTSNPSSWRRTGSIELITYTLMHMDSG